MTITPERKKLYGALHAAAKKAGLTEDADYRAMLVAQVGKDSAKDMTDGQIRQVLVHLNQGSVGAVANSRRRDDSPTSRKIRALWLSLYQLGVVRNASETALASFVRHLAKVDDLRWLAARDAYRVIEALKDMATRAGVRWADYQHPQAAVLGAQLQKLQRLLSNDLDNLRSIENDCVRLLSVAQPDARAINVQVKKLGTIIRSIAEGQGSDG